MRFYLMREMEVDKLLRMQLVLRYFSIPSPSPIQKKEKLKKKKKKKKISSPKQFPPGTPCASHVSQAYENGPWEIKDFSLYRMDRFKRNEMKNWRK